MTLERSDNYHSQCEIQAVRIANRLNLLGQQKRFTAAPRSRRSMWDSGLADPNIKIIEKLALIN